MSFRESREIFPSKISHGVHPECIEWVRDDNDKRLQLLSILAPLTNAKNSAHLFARRSVFLGELRVAGKKFYVAQRKYQRIYIAVTGDPALLAQHALTFGGKDKRDQQFASTWMWRGFHQCNWMDIGNHRLVEDILHGPALVLNACGNMRVGIADRVKFTGG